MRFVDLQPDARTPGLDTSNTTESERLSAVLAAAVVGNGAATLH